MYMHITAAAILLAVTSGAQAATVVKLFETNFDTIKTQTLPLTVYPVTDPSGNSFNLGGQDLAGWTITGLVDLHTPNGGIGFGVRTCAGPDPAGRCLDLAGRNAGAIISQPITFIANKPVTVSFDVSGSQRDELADVFSTSAVFGSPVPLASSESLAGPTVFTDEVVSRFLSGGPAYQVTLAANAPFVRYAYTFIPTVDGSFQIRFGTPTLSSRGPLLDNVLVTQTVDAVPEPATWSMLIAGFGIIGAASRGARRVCASPPL